MCYRQGQIAQATVAGSKGTLRRGLYSKALAPGLADWVVWLRQLRDVAEKK